MGTLRSELLRVGFSPEFEVTEAQRKTMWQEHVEALRLLEERDWELELGEKMRRHPERDVASIIASMPRSRSVGAG